MGHNLDVHVIDSDGKPVSGCKVKVVIEGVWKGGALKETFTDDEGHAEFTTAADYEPSRRLSIYVRGQSFGPYRIDGGAYTVRLD